MSWLGVCVDGTQNPRKSTFRWQYLVSFTEKETKQSGRSYNQNGKTPGNVTEKQMPSTVINLVQRVFRLLFQRVAAGRDLGCEIDSSFENCVWQFSTTSRSVLYSKVCLFGLPQTEFSRRFRSIVKNRHRYIYFLKRMSTKTRVPPGQRSANHG